MNHTKFQNSSSNVTVFIPGSEFHTATICVLLIKGKQIHGCGGTESHHVRRCTKLNLGTNRQMQI